MRQFVDYGPIPDGGPRAVGLTLARQLVSQVGEIVTDRGIEIGTSTPDQGVAVTSRLIFFVHLHRVAVERRGALMDNQVWRASTQQILDKAAAALGFRSTLRLQAVSENMEILREFLSFDVLTRFKVALRVPNPELRDFERILYDEMQVSSVRYLGLNMANYDGLNREPGRLPYAAASIADSGYRSGEATLEGKRGGEPVKVVTGGRAERVTLDAADGLAEIRQIVDGAGGMVTTGEAKRLVALLSAKIDEKIKPTIGGP